MTNHTAPNCCFRLLPASLYHRRPSSLPLGTEHSSPDVNNVQLVPERERREKTRAQPSEKDERAQDGNSAPEPRLEMFVQAQRCHPQPRAPKEQGRERMRKESAERPLVTGSRTLKVPHLREG